jgi:ribonuclease-3
MKTIHQTKQTKYRELESLLGYTFSQPALLEKALTHRSYSTCHNECFEFLGDSLLSAVVSHLLFNLYPDANEGDLSRMRSMLVCEASLAEIATELNLSQFIRMGLGEMRLGGQLRPSTQADALEAVLAVIYIESNFETLYQVIQRLFLTKAKNISIDEAKDAKTALQEWLQGQKLSLPVYSVVETSGPEHAKQFLVSCELENEKYAQQAWGSTRRCAEQIAAAKVLQQLGVAGFSVPKALGGACDQTVLSQKSN